MVQNDLLRPAVGYLEKSPKRISLARALFSYAVVVIVSAPCIAFPATFLAFGPENYVRGSGSPVTVTNDFTVLNPNTSYTLRITNGGLVDGEFEKVSSSVIALNGIQVLGPNEFNQDVTVVEKPVTVAASNQLSVEVRGKPGGGITIQVIGIDNDPPTIVAAVSPAPNAAGWHKVDATVSFSCADTISGVASCPGPVAVSTEAANQVISGMATDKAGNTASASVFISLDKTAPALTITSPSNGTSVTSSPVNVTGTVSDSISGLATVICNGSPASFSNSALSCEVPLTTGPNTIGVEAADVAGNTSTININVTLSEPVEPQNFPVAINAQGDLFGENWGEQIVFNWGPIEGAAGYIVYRSESLNAPWAEIFRITDNTSTGSKVDVTADARTKQLCYRVEAVNNVDSVIYIYEPMCVPKNP